MTQYFQLIRGSLYYENRSLELYKIMSVLVINTMLSLLRFALIVLALSLLQACSTLSYYQQAISGQMELLQKRKPIAAVIQDQGVDARIRKRLEMIVEARKFAVSELDLPDNDSYSEYADLGRPYALWNVFATAEFSLQPKQWCYPLFGCVSYRNYFSPVPAREYAEQLETEGLDVYVAGVPAYSTLGWFDDPVMNTMMHWQDYDLVSTLFHELAHQKFYVAGDTIFNESLAKAIEQEGLRRWMNQQSDNERFQDYLQDAQRERQFIDMVLKTRNKLEDLYQSSLSSESMSIRKLEILRGLRADYRQLRQQWGGYDAYDQWIFSGVNNAKIQSIATYYDYVPAFEKMLQRHQGDLQPFYAELRHIMTLTQKERRDYLLSRTAGGAIAE